MKLPLLFALLSRLVSFTITVVALFWGLPAIDFRLPLFWKILILLAVVAFSVITFPLVRSALTQPPLAGLTSMVGTGGKAVSPLLPEGMVQIKGELWQATAAEGIQSGEKVIVTAQQGLKLTVRRSLPGE